MATATTAPPTATATTPDAVPDRYGNYITALDPAADVDEPYRRFEELGVALSAECPCGCGVFMPHQRQALRLVAARRPGTLMPRYPDVDLTWPRQNGKSITSAVFLAERGTDPTYPHNAELVYTAQTRKAAAKRLGIFAVMYERAAIPIKYTQGVGNERIKFLETSAVIEIVPPTDLGGHGESLDALVADECWALSPVLMGGLGPARLARPRSQALYISTAGTVESEVYLALQRAGRESLTEPDALLAYMEHAADDNIDVHNPDTWHQWIPALGHTITLDSLKRLVASPEMTPTEVERSIGNRTVAAAQPVVPIGWWDETADPVRMPTDKDRLTLAVELGRGPSSIAIAAAWATAKDDAPHVELLDYQPTSSTVWLTARLATLLDRYNVGAVAIDKGGPAGAVYADVEEVAARHRVKVRNVWPREMGAACGSFYQRLQDRQVTHGAAPELDDAVRGARRKYVGDAWYWDRKSSTFDVTPLNAATMATFVLAEVLDKPNLNIY